jgi:anti-sigma factor ChrR (cupin superfamily)
VASAAADGGRQPPPDWERHTSVPEHDHGGSELDLVRAALVDASGRHGPGDVADLDEGGEHHARPPMLRRICVIANEAPARSRASGG